MASVFTQIVRGEIPAEKVYETRSELAFLDIHPKSPGHTLVVPKLEVASFVDLPPEAAASLMTTLQTVAKGVTQAMGTAHYNLVLNNGARAGQVVFHVHFHVIPRYEGFARGGGPSAPLAEIAESIRNAIATLQSGG